MKKLLSLVLICAMGFGMISCVESEESPSVTAIRNAKAEQLKALTNLYNAQAEAALIVANAEAALKAAEAEYQKLMTEQAKEIFAAELAKIKAEAEAALWDAKMKAAEYEQYIFETAEAKIQTLYINYALVLDNLSTANYDLVVAKANLLQLQEDADYAKANADYYIASMNRSKAGYEAQIEVLKDPKYTSVNKDSLYVLYRAAYKEYQMASKSYNMNEAVAANEARAAAIIAGNKFSQEIDEKNSKYGTLINQQYGNGKWLRGEIDASTGYASSWWGQDNVISVSVDEDNLLYAERSKDSNYEDCTKRFGTETDKFDYENEPWNASFMAKYNYVVEQTTKAAELIPAALEAQKVWDAANEASNKANAEVIEANNMPETTDAEKAAKKTAVEAATKAQKAAYAEFVKACKALAAFTDDNTDDKKDGSLVAFLTELNKSYNPISGCDDNLNIFWNPGAYAETTEDEDGNETTEYIDYYAIDEYGVKALQTNLENAAAKWADDLVSETATMQNITEQYENWNGFVAELRDFVAAKNEEIKDVDAANKAFADAEEARVAAYTMVNELNAKQKALNTLQSNAVDIAAEIQSIETWIAECDASIAEYEYASADADAQVELQKKQIANLEAQIEYLEALVESAKAALDAAISAQDAE